MLRSTLPEVDVVVLVSDDFGESLIGGLIFRPKEVVIVAGISFSCESLVCGQKEKPKSLDGPIEKLNSQEALVFLVVWMERIEEELA